jgi:hypothetical protein
MEEGDDSVKLDGPRVEFVEFLGRSNLIKPIMGCDPIESRYDNSESLDSLKKVWTGKFLKQGGLNFVIKYVMENSNKKDPTDADQKKISFMLVLLKVFISSSFDAD